MHRQTAFRQTHRDRRSERRLADAALAHDHHQAMAIGGDLVDQRSQWLGARRSAAGASATADPTGGATSDRSWRSAASPTRLKGFKAT